MTLPPEVQKELNVLYQTMDLMATVEVPWPTDDAPMYVYLVCVTEKLPFIGLNDEAQIITNAMKRYTPYATTQVFPLMKAKGGAGIDPTF